MYPVILAPPAAITQAWTHTQSATHSNTLDWMEHCEKLAAPPGNLCESGCVSVCCGGSWNLTLMYCCNKVTVFRFEFHNVSHCFSGVFFCRNKTVQRGVLTKQINLPSGFIGFLFRQTDGSEFENGISRIVHGSTAVFLRHTQYYLAFLLLLSRVHCCSVKLKVVEGKVHGGGTRVVLFK